MNNIIHTIRHSARAATALAQAARRATAALAIILLTATTAGARDLTGFLTVSSSGTASGYFAFSDHFYKVDWTGINTSQTTSVQLIYNSTYGRLVAQRNGDTSSDISLYTNADASYWKTSDITGLTPGQSSSGYTSFNELATGASSSSKKKACTVTCMAANTPTWNWSADNSTCTATFTCTASPSLTATVNATVTTSGSTATASATFNGTNYTDTKTIVTNYSITYVLNGGTNAAGNPTTYADIVGVASFANPTRTGYQFGGWYDNASFTGSPVTSIPAGSSGNKTLYAKWTPNTYTVSYNANGGSGTMSSQTFTYDAAQNLRANTFTRTGYTFGGWATTANGAVAYADKQSVSNLTSTQGADVELFAKWMPSQTHFSQSGDTYTINTATGWNVFCDLLAENGMGYFSGKTVQLGANITVTRMAGGSNHAFTGTFDGQGNTLFVNITGTVQGTAPFCEIKGATIRNLVVAGSVAGMRHSAGLVGFARGDDASVENTIENCLVATDVSITGDDRGYLGGIVGHGVHCKLTIRGCAFTGSLTSGSYYTGGLQGWSDGNTLILENDIFAASSVNAANVGFHPIAIHNNATTTATVSNVYYTIAPTCTTSTRIAAAGKQAHTVTAGENVTIGAIALTGTATQYTVSGITAYSGGGLQHGQTLYYGSDDQLSLTLSNSATGAPRGYQYGYTASAGTLSGSTLTMPDEDVTISVNTAALAPIDWATVNQGTSTDPYMIYNKHQLLLLAHRVNGTHGETAVNNGYRYKYFKLGADITFSHAADETDGYTGNYEAIGRSYNDTFRYFRGDFDGDGHSVSGIRIRKTGKGDTNSYQGLFGCIGIGAKIHDVHLTDARITGYEHVGGIVGYIYEGYIRRCTVTDSYITATHYRNYGTICGENHGTLTNNYYHGCTVNGTAATSGMGCKGADITDDNGALPAYRLALGANITTPPGTFVGQTRWLATPPASARLAPENGFTLAGNHYFASGYEFTPGSTLASGAAQGYTPRATLGDQLLDLYTPTGNTDPLAGKAIARLTITADCDGKTLASTQAIYSTREPVNVAYIKADGTPDEASAIALDGTETVDGDGDVCLDEGTYYVGTDITYANQIYLNGDVTLILADGKTLTLNGDTPGIINDSRNLTIYGQSLDDNAGTISYKGTADGITVNNYEQHSGNVRITTIGSTIDSWVWGIDANAVTLLGGTLTVTANSTNAIALMSGTHSILGGQLTATATGTDATGIYASADDGTAITLGWTRPADRITASSISAPYGGTVAVADGQALTDGSGHIYTGTLTASELSGFAAETTLQPCLALADAADNNAAIADHAGKTLAVALSGRTLYKDGSWNTLCLPFDISTASGTLSGDNVQAMTLNTTTSNLTGSTLTLNFDAATTIDAGTPFIIKWDNTGVNIENPVFEGVTVSNATNDATVEGVLTFTGTYTPVTTPAAGDNTKLYLGSANTLYYPNAAMTISCQRAYFQLLGDLTAGNPASLVRAFVLNFGDDGSAGDPARIHAIDAGEGARALHGWYTLDGRRLDGQPTAKGLYIHGGKKVVIK